ncbi:TQXA domain-containing protein [Mycobacterium cookii]|uniref:TQXA domain-containing protein n=1 Tax=Mycobacterium cookii TaxID=1775 RepID=A0A7I7KVL8_9MYCO|nr:TQXA domain-containing protein [Mycobacterium cookii]MCV7328746.1 TQXA domain-containing protein [Mycobacterium cookii]BBX45372.1 TQXA domain-containing protein [Mycobacterium cookii]
MTLLSMPAPTQVTTGRRLVVRPARELPQMTRYRGGTYSHTVDRIVFADGSTARTDLIRLNPNLDAYSLDFTGIAPRLPSRYQLGTWSALPHLRARGREAQIGWILRHSFPIISIAELSRQLRAAGYPLGAANIADHEAIAATQAAIWYFTNGLALDTQPLNVPVTVRRGPGPVITYEFDDEPQLGGYSVWTTTDAPVNLRLQKSANGVDWHDVSGSQMTTGPARARYQRGLGVGSTVSSSSHGRRGRGFRFYRLITTPPADAPNVGHVSFWLTGTTHYRNADRVVHLYNYLLAGAIAALRETVEPQLITRHAVAEDGLVGPFYVRTPLALNVTDGHELVDADGVAIEVPVQPGHDFYIRPAEGCSRTTLIAATPRPIAGRVLTGVAADNAPQRFTPVALAVPTDVAIHFDIDWD